MRHIYSALIIATLLSASAFTQNDDQASDRAYIHQAESDWAESAANQDCGAMERILADDFVGVGVDGTHYTKVEAVNHCKTHESNFEFNHLKKVDIRFYGDMAIAQGSEGWKLKTGKPGEFIWTDTWLKRNGTWRIVAAEDLMPAPDPFANAPLREK